MQLQEQTYEADARPTGDDRTRRDHAGQQNPPELLAMAPMGKSVATARATTLGPFKFAMRKSRNANWVAAGSLFAHSRHEAKHEARLLANNAQRVLCHMLPDVPAASFVACPIYIEPRPLPLAEPPLFALRNEDWLTYAGEVIVCGPLFFGPRASSRALAVPALVQTALRESRTDEHVRSILATDPAVRRAWLDGRYLSWSLLQGYMPAVRPVARAAIHLTADDAPIALQACTIAAVLCILLRANNYSRRKGITYHRQDKLDPMPNSAVARAALAQAHRQPSNRRVHDAALAIACLRRAGLDDLARRIEAQAMAALPAIAP
ncbi:hypothetical protein [Bosea sp. (in: a-proteobacteria)]|uniref:hypothetical protein n=1 Tax=Bosea sp. (in: a-proteobacteria) TaxID=1871050 RepID=UPI0025B9ED46|nr:hypothetical protein [Bosea sp. (in: a-proteobacteria)]